MIALPTVAVLGLSVLAIAVIVAWAITRDRRRARALAALGARLGLRYAARGTGIAKRLAGVPAVAAAPHQRFSHVLEGEDELICDWSTVHKLEKRRTTRLQTLLAIRRPGAGWPSFRGLARGSSGRGLESFSGRVVEFPESTPFDGRFRIEALDREGVLALLSSERRHGLDLPEEVVLEAGEDWLVAYTPRRRLSPEAILRLRDRLRGWADRLAE